MAAKERVVVTGGAGFIGSHITDLLIRKGYEVAVFDDLSTGKKENINPKAKFTRVDIASPALLSALKKFSPQYIIHEAAQISVSRSVRFPLEDARVNVTGALNLLDYAARNKVKKFIFASSGGTVYGKYPADENCPLDPISPYGITKAVMEWYLRFYHKEYGLRYTSLRYSNVYGPRQDPHGEAGVVAIFCRKLLAGEACVINGDGKYIRDYVYCKDVARANFLALRSSATGGLNIGTGISTDVNQLYSKIVKVLGINTKAKYGPHRAGDLRKSLLDWRKAKKALGWKPLTGLDEGISETVGFFRSELN